MACLFGHKWSGCKCERCGKKRDEQHDWDLCKGICKRCGAKQPEQHDWNGCKCSLCGKIRDEQHIWNGYKCSICGKKRSIGDITNQAILADIVKDDDDLVYRKTAADRLTDQSILTDIAQNDSNATIRFRAVRKLNCQSILADIAANDIDIDVRLEAALKINDQSLSQKILAEIIVMKHNNNSARIRAIENLIDPIVLVEVKEMWKGECLYEIQLDVGSLSEYVIKTFFVDLHWLIDIRLRELKGYKFANLNSESSLPYEFIESPDPIELAYIVFDSRNSDWVRAVACEELTGLDKIHNNS